jgi:hypothetical protein
MPEILKPTPEQTQEILKMLGMPQKEEETPAKEIGRGEFMTRINGKRKDLIKDYQEASALMEEAKDGLWKCAEIERQILDLEDNDYRITYLIDDEENIFYKAKPKERMGFHGT